MIMKQFKVAHFEEEPECNGLFLHFLIAKDGEAWRVLRNRTAFFPSPWDVGDVIDVQMSMQEAAGGEGEFLFPVWEDVHAERPIKYDLAKPYDSVKRLWGEKIADQLRASLLRYFQTQRQKHEHPVTGSATPATPAGGTKEPPKVYWKAYVCWIVYKIHRKNRLYGHVMVATDGEAWIVERCGKSVRKSGWEEGRVVEVTLRLFEDKQTGDRWMRPDWQEHGVTATPTTLEPEHLDAIAKVWQSRGQEMQD